MHLCWTWFLGTLLGLVRRKHRRVADQRLLKAQDPRRHLKSRDKNVLSLVTAYLGHEIKSFLDPVLVFLLQVQAHPEVLPDIARKSLPILLVAEPFLLYPKIFGLLQWKLYFYWWLPFE